MHGLGLPPVVPRRVVASEGEGLRVDADDCRLFRSPGDAGATALAPESRIERAIVDGDYASRFSYRECNR